MAHGVSCGIGNLRSAVSSKRRRPEGGHGPWWLRAGAKVICEPARIKKILEDHLAGNEPVPSTDRIEASQLRPRRVASTEVSRSVPRSLRENRRAEEGEFDGNRAGLEAGSAGKSTAKPSQNIKATGVFRNSPQEASTASVSRTAATPADLLGAVSRRPPEQAESGID